MRNPLSPTGSYERHGLRSPLELWFSFDVPKLNRDEPSDSLLAGSMQIYRRLEGRRVNIAPANRYSRDREGRRGEQRVGN